MTATHSATAKAALAKRSTPALDEVQATVPSHRVVVVGMGWNPHCKRAVAALETAGVDHQYLSYGNYLTGWQDRLAIKMWAGWPTFPMVFVDGELLGGANETQAAIADGSLTAG